MLIEGDNNHNSLLFVLFSASCILHITSCQGSSDSEKRFCERVEQEMTGGGRREGCEFILFLKENPFADTLLFNHRQKDWWENGRRFSLSGGILPAKISFQRTQTEFFHAQLFASNENILIWFS